MCLFCILKEPVNLKQYHSWRTKLSLTNLFRVKTFLYFLTLVVRELRTLYTDMRFRWSSVTVSTAKLSSKQFSTWKIRECWRSACRSTGKKYILYCALLKPRNYWTSKLRQRTVCFFKLCLLWVFLHKVNAENLSSVKALRRKIASSGRWTLHRKLVNTVKEQH